MSNVKQSDQELRNHLKEQFGFLVQSSISYDKGFDGEAKRLALTMRILLHDSKNSTSLLKQLGIKNIKFCCTCKEEYNKKLYSTGFHCLVSVFKGKPQFSKYIPSLYFSPHDMKWVSLQKWLDKVVVVDGNKNKFTRQRLIRHVCNQDGGAHVDPSLDKQYHEFSRKNSLGWKYCSNGKWFDFSSPELASIRQMANEIIITLTKALPELEETVESNILSEALNPKIDLQGLSCGGLIIITEDNKDFIERHMKIKI
jgi:hypothetical protein